MTRNLRLTEDQYEAVAKRRSSPVSGRGRPVDGAEPARTAKQSVSKYRNKPVTVNGIRFGSQKEADRYGELKIAEKAKDIRDLVVHPVFQLFANAIPICKYEADFKYHDGKQWVIEDCKGQRNRKSEAYRLFLLKKKWMKACYDIEILET